MTAPTHAHRPIVRTVAKVLGAALLLDLAIIGLLAIFTDRAIPSSLETIGTTIVVALAAILPGATKQETET